jgi:BASS family bile acid:Na+ symporter
MNALAALLPLGLAFIMFSLGLRLSTDDFRRVLSHPAPVALGLLAQIVLLPLTALAIARVFDLEPALAVGLMILAACPGGVSAAMITHLARGDTCLSITLTALTSLLAFLTVPLIVGLSLAHFLDQSGHVAYPVGQGVVGLFLITLLPVAVGVYVNRSGRISARMRHAIGTAATSVFALIVIATFVTEWASITRHFAAIGGAILLLNVLTMATGAAIGAAGRLPADGRVALAVECGIQNSALGITVAVSLLAQPALAVPSVIYAFLMNGTALALILARRVQVGGARAEAVNP